MESLFHLFLFRMQWGINEFVASSIILMGLLIDTKLSQLQRVFISILVWTIMKFFRLVIKPTTVWIVLSIALPNSWPLKQLHVNNALMNGTLRKQVFMSQLLAMLILHALLMCATLESRFIVLSKLSIHDIMPCEFFLWHLGLVTPILIPFFSFIFTTVVFFICQYMLMILYLRGVAPKLLVS